MKEVSISGGGTIWHTAIRRSGVGTGIAPSYDTSPRQLWIYTDPEWDDPQRYTFAGPQ